jgi:hypothetical protein
LVIDAVEGLIEDWLNDGAEIITSHWCGHD